MTHSFKIQTMSSEGRLKRLKDTVFFARRSNRIPFPWVAQKKRVSEESRQESSSRKLVIFAIQAAKYVASWSHRFIFISFIIFVHLRGQVQPTFIKTATVDFPTCVFLSIVCRIGRLKNQIQNLMRCRWKSFPLKKLEEKIMKVFFFL